MKTWKALFVLMIPLMVSQAFCQTITYSPLGLASTELNTIVLPVFPNEIYSNPKTQSLKLAGDRANSFCTHTFGRDSVANTLPSFAVTNTVHGNNILQVIELKFYCYLQVIE